MGVKTLVFLVGFMILISACSMDKTKPIISEPGEEVVDSGVTDITGKAVDDLTDAEVEEDAETDEIDMDEPDIDEPDLNESEDVTGVHTVIIKDLKLNPKELTIKKGDTVVWEHEDTWEDEGSTRHYIAAHTNEFRSSILFYGDTFEHTFENEGTFTYIDVLYKERNALRGKIVVE